MLSIYKNADPNISRVLVGNKLDLVSDTNERCMPEKDCHKLAEEHGMEYFETSAKDNVNISESMTFMIEKVYDRMYGASKLPTEEDVGKPSVTIGQRSGGRGSAAGPGG